MEKRKHGESQAGGDAGQHLRWRRQRSAERHGGTIDGGWADTAPAAHAPTRPGTGETDEPPERGL